MLLAALAGVLALADGLIPSNGWLLRIAVVLLALAFAVQVAA